MSSWRSAASLYFSVRLFPLLALLLLLPLGCDSGGGDPAGPDDGDDDPTPEVSQDTAVATIGSDGGTVALPDGTGVYFPPGAVSGSTAVSIIRGDPAEWFEGTTEAERAVVEASASVSTFNTEVELRLPLPAGMTEADSTKVMAGLIDDTTHAVTVVPSSIRMIDGKPFLIVETTHFSSWLYEKLFGKDPPPSYGPITIPYYNQGSSNYCWATSVHMVTQAARYDEDNTIPEIIGRMGVDETGITSGSFRLSSTLGTLIKGRTSVQPFRQTWDYVNVRQMKYYLWREIGLNHRPVALFNGDWNHAVVIVGYSDLNTFIIHDPASTNNNDIGYTTKTWTQIAGGMGATDNMVTLAIPMTPGSVGGPLRINFLPLSMEFVKPSGGSGDPSAIYRYNWDYTQEAGFSFRHASTEALADPLPGSVATFKVGGDIQLTNASRSTNKEASVWIDINALGSPSGWGGYSDHLNVEVAANAAKSFKPDDVPVDEFRYNKATPTEYLLTVSALVEGSTVDQHRMRFKVASVTPEITGVDPSPAIAGTTVTIEGQGFGQLPKHNKVELNGATITGITSWSDTRISFSLPADATSGDLVVTRGEVPSAPFPLIVQSYMTSQSFDLKWGHADQGFEFTTTVTVEATGEGYGWTTVYEDRSIFDPDAWVKLWFGTTEQAEGGSQQFQITVTVNSVRSDREAYEGTIDVIDFEWVVRSQTPNGLPATHVVGNPVTITEAASLYSKSADLYIKVKVTPSDGDEPFTISTSPGLAVSFHPGHTGMVPVSGG